MASGCRGRIPLAPRHPSHTHHSVPSPSRLGSPEACPLPTRKTASRADSPAPTQMPGERVSQPRAPRLRSSGPQSTWGHNHQPWAWAVADCGRPLPSSPKCTHGWCFPLLLSWQKVWAYAPTLWLVADKPVDFESYLIPGF